MARYPTLPQNMSTDDIKRMYSEIQRWGSILINELNNRDTVVERSYTRREDCPTCEES